MSNVVIVEPQNGERLSITARIPSGRATVQTPSWNSIWLTGIVTAIASLSACSRIVPRAIREPRDGTGAETPAHRRCDLFIEPDFEKKTIAIRAQIDIEIPAPKSSFEFGLSDLYTVVAIEADGMPVKIERHNGELTVMLPQPARRVSLVFRLRGSFGRPAAGEGDEGRPVIDDESLFLLWSDRFYPIDFDEWSLLRIEIVLPARFKAIAPGQLLSAERHDDNRLWVFQTTHPVGPSSVLADSRWTETQRTVNGIPMRTLLHPESRQYAEKIFATSSDVLKFFSELHGSYPFDGFTFVTVARMGARRAFPGFVAYEPGYLKKEFTTTGYDAHETALLWWGYTTHGRGPGAFAWTEGLGDYVEFMYDEARGKPIPAIFEHFQAEYLKTAAVEDRHYTDLGGAPQQIIHGRYPWVMQALRKELGDDAFRQGIRLLFRRYRWRTFSMDDFIATFEEAGSRSLESWRAQWLERPPARLRQR